MATGPARYLRRSAGVLGCLVAAASAQVADFESPSTLDAATLLGDAAIRGEHFSIEREVTNDGFMNRLVVVSRFQRIEALGNSLALERAREQEAIAALREIKKTDAFRDGIEKAIEAPLVVSRQALSDPGALLADVPQGLSNLLQDNASAVASAVASTGKGSVEEQHLAAALKEIAGYTHTKRRLAAQLGVDPFSSNEVLQHDLDDVSWAVFAGGASVDLAMTQAPMWASLSLEALRALQRARSSLWDIPIATLQQASVHALEETGLAADEARSLIYSTRCTLTQQTRLVAALADLEGVSGRDAFARMTQDAANEAACRRHVETARLLWLYHRVARPLERVDPSGAVVRARDVDARELLVLRADYLAWTSRAAQLAAALPEAEQRWLWISGSLSSRSRREFERRGFRAEERVFDRFPQEIDVAAILTPERASRAPEDEAENQTRRLLDDAEDRSRMLLDDAREGARRLMEEVPDPDASP